jgi:hypothetical protein
LCIFYTFRKMRPSNDTFADGYNWTNSSLGSVALCTQRYSPNSLQTVIRLGF